MTALHAIDPDAYAHPADRYDGDPGPMPTLQWIAIEKLRIDPTYQRTIQETGRRNVRRIAMEFDWSKFAPVIVAHVGGSLYAIIDGQHRTTAAAVRGIKKVPCQVVEADRARQASAFAAINANVTAMSPLQLHAARLAAGDRRAVAIGAVCAEADVTICRYPVPADKMKAGETLAVGKLYRLFEKYGPEVLRLAMRCITRTRNGYPGLLRAQMVEAFCAVLEAEPEWRAEKRLLVAIQRLDLQQVFADARKAQTEGSLSGIVSSLIERLSDHLDKNFAAAAA